MWHWTTKPVIRVNFFKLRFIQALYKLSVDVYVAEIQLFENLEPEGTKKILILRKSPLKFLAMHITNPKKNFNIW